MFYGYLEQNNIDAIITNTYNNFKNKINKNSDSDSNTNTDTNINSKHHRQLNGIYIYRAENSKQKSKANTLENYYQIGQNNIKIEMITDLLISYLKEPIENMIAADNANTLFSFKKSIKDEILVNNLHN